MKKINYITKLSVKEISGGWSGMNHNIFNQLQSGGKFSINTVEEIDPPVSHFWKLVSKISRSLFKKGNFYYYQRERLLRIKKEVEALRDHDAVLDFYHGATPWILVKKERPYAIYLDACFYTYVSVYLNKDAFSARHLKYLFDQEAAFIDNAAVVFFSSSWSLEQTKKAYGLTGKNFLVAGLGGNVPVPDVYNPEYDPYFLFAGLDFEGKGGHLVSEAFSGLQQKFPGFGLYFVGARPPESVLAIPGTRYMGYFDKKDPKQAEELARIFGRAFLLVLPTNKDMTPLVIVEAGYNSCPAVAVRNFGIPEMIKDGETGFLLDSPPDAVSIQRAMEKCCGDQQFYLQLRQGVYNYMTRNFTWNRTGKIIMDELGRLV